jgi:GH35 family endo-1,4-beta-xylanase
MRLFKDLSKLGKIGLLVFIILNVSFIFLLLSPYIPNLIGEYQDEILLEQCQEDIIKYRTGDVKIKVQFANGTPASGYNISFNHIRHNFIFGCNIFSFDSYNESLNPGYNNLYKTYFKDLFNLAVLPFYWTGYEPVQGNFPTQSRLNDIINWCSLNNITTKGHPIHWTRPSGKPSWLPLENDSKMLDLIKNRTKTIISQYKDIIEYWDVVNEPIHTETYAGLTRENFCLYTLQWANQTNPDTHLTINDYGIIGHDFGGGPYYQLLNSLISNNAPIEFIGLQSHEPRTDWISATEIWATYTAYAELGKTIHITEFEPVSAAVPITNSWKKGTWSEAAQAEYARRFYTLSFAHPGVGAVIWWDLCDFGSWLEEGGLIDNDMTPKPVYNYLDQLINDQWRTKGSQLSNSTGWIDFQGFYGIYNISIQNGAYNFQIKAASDLINEFILEI